MGILICFWNLGSLEVDGKYLEKMLGIAVWRMVTEWHTFVYVYRGSLK